MTLRELVSRQWRSYIMLGGGGGGVHIDSQILNTIMYIVVLKFYRFSMVVHLLILMLALPPYEGKGICTSLTGTCTQNNKPDVASLVCTSSAQNIDIGSNPILL